MSQNTRCAERGSRSIFPDMASGDFAVWPRSERHPSCRLSGSTGRARRCCYVGGVGRFNAYPVPRTKAFRSTTLFAELKANHDQVLGRCIKRDRVRVFIRTDQNSTDVSYRSEHGKVRAERVGGIRCFESYVARYSDLRAGLLDQPPERLLVCASSWEDRRQIQSERSGRRFDTSAALAVNRY